MVGRLDREPGTRQDFPQEGHHFGRAVRIMECIGQGAVTIGLDPQGDELTRVLGRLPEDPSRGLGDAVRHCETMRGTEPILNLLGRLSGSESQRVIRIQRTETPEMETFGQLTQVQGRYEYRCDAHNLIIRGDFAEWVLAAAAEITAKIARDELDGRLNELEALAEFGEGDPIDLDVARFEMKERFEILPQCIVTVGRGDFRWVASEARPKLSPEFDEHPIRRLQDMALTRGDTFLKNEPGIDAV